MAPSPGTSITPKWGGRRRLLRARAPRYDPRRKERHPVFSLLHGLGGEANSWIKNGAANVILDKLIAQGKVRPMVMVSTLGYGHANGPQSAMRDRVLHAYTKRVLRKVLPPLEKICHVSRDRTQRAITGLSMEGTEGSCTGLKNLA